MADLSEIYAELEQNVPRGAAWLDKAEPGWADKIDTATLDLNSCHYCMMGQLHGDYWKFMDETQRSDKWAERHGFYYNLIERGMRYKLSHEVHVYMKDLWIAEIAKRG
jgi:hypothetical protein